MRTISSQQSNTHDLTFVSQIILWPLDATKQSEQKGILPRVIFVSRDPLSIYLYQHLYLVYSVLLLTKTTASRRTAKYWSTYWANSPSAVHLFGLDT